MSDTFTIQRFAPGQVLSSRGRARALRKQLDGLLLRHPRIVVDFDGVEVLAESFADELLGVIVLARGAE
jgi:hypothetical protein